MSTEQEIVIHVNHEEFEKLVEAHLKHTFPKEKKYALREGYFYIDETTRVERDK